MVLGRASLAVLRGLSGLAGDDMDAEAREIIRRLRRVETTTYRVGSECATNASLSAVPARFADEGWRSMVSTVEGDGERTWVLTRTGSDDSTTGILVIALDQDELEVVRLDGDIDRVLIAATADDPETVLRLADDG